jgi:hypothetical protein
MQDVSLDIDFDSGSLDVKQSAVENDRIHLVGFQNHNAGFWKWLHFRARGVRGRKIRFEIDNQFEPGSERLDHHRMVFSFDAEQWSYFDWHEHDKAGASYRFGNDSPFEHDEVFVAYGIPYPFERLKGFLSTLRMNDHVSPAPSADEDFVIGFSPGGIAEGNRPIASNELFGIRIADSDESPARRRVVILGGVHPNEPLGNWAIEGLVTFLLGDSDEARAIRSTCEILVYPMVNPDGRVAGYNRSTVQHEDRDANRFWREDLYDDMDDIRLMAEAIKSDSKCDVDYFIDFHCWTNSGPHFGILARAEGFHRDPLWLALRELEPTLDEMDSGWENWSTETFAFKRLNARFAMTLETMFIPGESVDRLKQLGENVGRALAIATSNLRS